MREQAENQLQCSLLVKGAPQAKKGKHTEDVGD